MIIFFKLNMRQHHFLGSKEQQFLYTFSSFHQEKVPHQNNKTNIN